MTQKKDIVFFYKQRENKQKETNREKKRKKEEIDWSWEKKCEIGCYSREALFTLCSSHTESVISSRFALIAAELAKSRLGAALPLASPKLSTSTS